MPWLRLSDTAAHDPRVVGVLEHPEADDRTADELFGFITRLATLAAQHATDYAASYPTAVTIAGSRTRADRLLALAEFSGYGTNEIEETGRRRFVLVDDPGFIHMKTAEEIAWEKSRKRDNSNPEITAVVRHRDGDACRYCGKVVNWSDRKGGMGGTYDHRPPGVAATPETMVVACRSCNSERGRIGRGMAPEEALAAADAQVPLWGVPGEPYYKPATRTYLAQHGAILAQHGMTPPAPSKATTRALPAGAMAPGTEKPPFGGNGSADPAPDGVRPAAPGSADPAPDGVRPAAPKVTENAPRAGVRPEPPPPKQAPTRQNVPSSKKADRQGPISRFPGSGRDGSGRVGSGGGGAGAASPAQGGRRRRGRRGGRSQSGGQAR